MVIKNIVATESIPTNINNKDLETSLKQLEIFIDEIGSTNADIAL